MPARRKQRLRKNFSITNSESSCTNGCTTASRLPGWDPARVDLSVTVFGNLTSMQQTPDEIFDEASGDRAVGDLQSAAAKYRRCVEIAPDFFDGWHALGMALMKLGRFG